MIRLCLLMALLGGCHIGCFATGDSLSYLTARDTVLLEISDRGQKLFRHRLEKGQTLYSLASFYGLTLDMLFDYNPQFKGKVVRAGSRVVVPIPNRAIIRTLRPGAWQRRLVPLYYRVKHGDTMFGIARRAFRMPVDSLMERNGLESPTLRVGQVLHVGWVKAESISKDWQIQAGNGSPGANENAKNKNEFLRKGYTRTTRVEKGKAQWNRKGNAALSGLYCLHAKAPMGSAVRIENPITKNVCYAKVVGQVPFNYESDIVVVVSKDVAKALNAIDERFFVKVEYFSR